jgi:hypothetical protein
MIVAIRLIIAPEGAVPAAQNRALPPVKTLC